MDTVILLAAGSGTRMQGIVEDKLLAPLCGQAIFSYSLQAFIVSEVVDHAVIVYRDAAQRSALDAIVSNTASSIAKLTWVQGGSERQDSVYNALIASEQSRYVYIHDCARPLIRPSALRQLKETLDLHPAAVLAHPVIDTIKRLPQAGKLEQTELEDLERSRLWAMETPQAFHYTEILKAYRHVRNEQLQITDDAAAASTIGLKITLVPNEQPNPKVTTPSDLAYAAFLFESSQ